MREVKVESGLFVSATCGRKSLSLSPSALLPARVVEELVDKWIVVELGREGRPMGAPQNVDPGPVPPQCGMARHFAGIVIEMQADGCPRVELHIAEHHVQSNVDRSCGYPTVTECPGLVKGRFRPASPGVDKDIVGWGDGVPGDDDPVDDQIGGEGTAAQQKQDDEEGEITAHRGVWFDVSLRFHRRARFVQGTGVLRSPLLWT